MLNHERTDTDYTQSETLRQITEALNGRYQAGETKYGRHVDDMVPPTEITGETSFAEMAFNELQDGITYALKAKQDYEALSSRNDQLKKHYADLSASAANLLNLNQDLVKRVEELESQVELLEGARREAIHEGDLTREAEAELLHQNVELERQVGQLKREVRETKDLAASWKKRYFIEHRRANTAELRVSQAETNLGKVPTFVKRVYGVRG